MNWGARRNTRTTEQEWSETITKTAEEGIKKLRKEAIKRYNKEYNEKNKAKLKALRKEYQEKSKEKLKEIQKELREKNKKRRPGVAIYHSILFLKYLGTSLRFKGRFGVFDPPEHLGASVACSE